MRARSPSRAATAGERTAVGRDGRVGGRLAGRLGGRHGGRAGGRLAGRLGGRAGGRDTGALILGYVIVVPSFLLAMMVVTQAALWYLARSAALAAARQGVDAARVMHSSPSAGRAAATSFAQRAASGYLLGPSASTVGSTATTIKITVSGHVPSLVPGLPIRISQVAEGPVERFTKP